MLKTSRLTNFWSPSIRTTAVKIFPPSLRLTLSVAIIIFQNSQLVYYYDDCVYVIYYMSEQIMKLKLPADLSTIVTVKVLDRIVHIEVVEYHTSNNLLFIS